MFYSAGMWDDELLNLVLFATERFYSVFWTEFFFMPVTLNASLKTGISTDEGDFRQEEFRYRARMREFIAIRDLLSFDYKFIGFIELASSLPESF